ncbi:uncharacterized protein N7515_004898 [Penicillium bovifimosum]|uniref:Grh/CP2 DB domain-containing protein n=1 Tax=Penicillium bovifimosum TaxID=126998 RepID=A0A9W9H1A1_9EURO|nr:uncharacterized protein N7515_004898 [Penicillium bovifimosum]KAJ5135620.1 hypothetical protein N7515_004898 [Penicillium bovifimosum]
MFNSRKAQKPDGEFITRFQQAFSDIVPRRDSQGAPSEGSRTARVAEHMMDTGMMDTDGKMESHDVKFPIVPNNDRTPRNMQELGMTPSWMEPGSFSMMPFTNQHSGLYTPNSGAMGPIFHNQAGDLHTPTGMHLIAPLSLSGMPAHNLHSNAFEPFHPQFMNSMHEINPYTQQPSYAPSAFMHRDPGYDIMDDTPDDTSTSMNDTHAETASNMTASTDFSAHMGGDLAYTNGEKFRFNVTLRAPTAMVKNHTEIPITYLNKGQAYNISVLDSTPPMISHEPVQYRTFIRVCFEEQEQRARPSACWQLWKEGRGINEAHQRGGKLLAVEYVDPLQGGGDVHRHRQVQIESMCVDGFSVTWTANPATGVADCNIPVRFNFLSTDFSHSKGVKGIPVRLCAKTELLSPGEEIGASRDTELAYCKVKLFRDHGAERKLSNDVAHVKKSIDKLKQQVSQAELGGGFAKRKRGHASGSVKGSDRSVKSLSQKRTWSIGSDDGPKEKLSLEDDLHAKLSSMQEMFSSTRSVSILGLRGDTADDPDLYPIRLSNDGDCSPFHGMSRSNTRGLDSIMPSPPNTNASSSNSPPMPATRLGKRSTTVPRVTSVDQSPRGFLEAVGVDSTYRPPTDRAPKPIACFYVRLNAANSQQSQDYYRAIYLTERTVQDLVNHISLKYQIDSSTISSVIHVNQKGLRVMVDDDVVRELPEGQDMTIDISDAPGSTPGTSGTLMQMELTY